MYTNPFERRRGCAGPQYGFDAKVVDEASTCHRRQHESLVVRESLAGDDAPRVGASADAVRQGSAIAHVSASLPAGQPGVLPRVGREEVVERRGGPLSEDAEVKGESRSSLHLHECVGLSRG